MHLTLRGYKRWMILIQDSCKINSQNICFQISCLKNRYPLKVSPNFSLENLRQNFSFRLVERTNIVSSKLSIMDLKKLLSNAKLELSNALDLIVEFSGCPRHEVLEFSKVKGIKDTLDELSNFDFEHNKYFGRNLLARNYQKGFEFKTAIQYENLTEWLDNVYISQNENVSIRTTTSDRIFIMDKRLGFNYSTMGEFLPIKFIDDIKNSEEKAQAYLITYFIKKNQNIIS